MTASSDFDTLIIKSGKLTKRFAPKEVAYVSCDSPVCDIHFVDGKKFACTKSLRYFEETFPEGMFFRISHKHMVNLNEVAGVISGGGHRHDVMLKNGVTLAVSYRKWAAFKESLR